MVFNKKEYDREYQRRKRNIERANRIKTLLKQEGFNVDNMPDEIEPGINVRSIKSEIKKIDKGDVKSLNTPILRKLRQLGAELPNRLRNKVKTVQARQYQQRRSARERASKVKRFLDSQRFWNTQRIPEELPVGFNVSKLEREIKSLRTGMRRDHPKLIKELVSMGVALPSDLRIEYEKISNKSRVKKVERDTQKEVEEQESFKDQTSDQDTPQDVQNQLKQNTNVAKKSDFSDIVAQAKGNPDEIIINGEVVKVDELRDIIQTEGFDAHRGKVPRGDRAMIEYERLESEFQRMNNNEIIVLYAHHYSGRMWDNFENYESANDGINTRGMLDLYYAVTASLGR